MKVAFLSESAADEAAVRILVEGLLGREIEPVAKPRLRTRGWPSVLSVFPIVLKQLYYETDAEALVVVVDSNHSPVYPEHGQTAVPTRGCRLSLLHQAATRASQELGSIPGRPRLRTGIGVAVPAIEASYRCGRDPTVSESAWLSALGSSRFPYDKNALKRDVYGTDRP